ncbi:MAG: haloacid dehalogenase type II, partial [Candidatus Kapaibacteriota bacterium]
CGVVMIDFMKIEAMTFDCYGTLIDWETGIINALKPLLEREKISLDNETILELYAQFESKIEQGEYITYKEVLRNVVKMFNQHFSTNIDLDSLLKSFQSWEPFEDTVETLMKLKSRFKLVVLSNVDKDLFELTKKKLVVQFDRVFTAEDIKVYKPSKKFFEYAITNLKIDVKKIVHIAQSLYHDIKPAKEFGISTVWVNRRKGKGGGGATPHIEVTPDLEVPDLKSLAELIFV